MTDFLSNRDSNSKTNEAGHLRAASRIMTGQVISGYRVRQNTTPNMSVLVGGESGTYDDANIPTGTGYSYQIFGDTSSVSATIPTANSSNPRTDYILKYIDLTVNPTSATTNNPGVVKTAVVSGSPGSSAPVPTVSQIQAAIGSSSPYIILASVLVGTSVTTITNSNITDLRVMASAVVASLLSSKLANPIKALAYASVGQSVSTTPVKIQCNVELYDTGGNYDNTTNYRFVVPTGGAGWYDIKAMMNMFVVPNIYCQAHIYKNGVELTNGTISGNSSGGNGPIQSLAAIEVALADGDYIEMYGTASASYNTGVGSAPFQTYLNVSLRSKS